MNHAIATHPGRFGGPNEDAHGVLSETRLFAVADGMGAAPNGARASQMAIDTVADFYHRAAAIVAPDPASGEEAMRRAFEHANSRVWRNNADVEASNRMGTTLVCAQFWAAAMVVGWVGDSRCYRFRQGRMDQLTRDHVILEQSRPHVSPSELEALRPLQQVLSRSIGRRAAVEVDLQTHAVEAGDLYLLCSNGLWEAVPKRMMVEVLGNLRSLGAACETVVRAANALGEGDNITAILIEP